MRVKEIMTTHVEVIGPDNTVEEAAQKMRQLDVGPLPVCEDLRLIGILTDRDIAIRSTAQGEDPTQDQVRDVMTREAIFCFEDDTVETAAQLMRERQVRRLLVLDRQKLLVGILSLGDLAVDTADERLAGETLERVSEPSKPTTNEGA